jgi:amino acid transporter
MSDRRLLRVLGLRHLIAYGMVLISPLAPVGIFGLAGKISHGHVTTAILVGMVAMMLTAASYGRMASVYPSAGSAYTYVSRSVNPHLGFLAGWAMILDYLIIPIINVAYVALTLERLLPTVPYAIWATAIAIVVTLLNLRSVKVTARANEILLAVMFVVVAAFVFLAVRHLSGTSHLFSWKPLYNPATFRLGDLATATSLAALTYIGFDGVTTLAEETVNPGRVMPLATVLVCAITGILSAVEVYLAQMVWPDFNGFHNLETAFLDVCARVGGTLLFQIVGAILVLASFGSALGGQAAAARLLFSMGRDGVLPKRVFGTISAATATPVRNTLLVGALAWAGALWISWQRAVEMLNFGAFLAFMGVNVAALCYFYWPASKFHLSMLLPLFGFVFCLGIWLSLPLPAKIAGGSWFLVGLIYSAIRTRGFRQRPAVLRFDDSPSEA